MKKLARLLGQVVLALVISFAITAVGQLLWGTMVLANVKLTPAIPWAPLAMAPILAGLVVFLAGRGWPHWGSETRRNLVPLAPVSRAAWVWSLVAGAMGVVALAALWTVLTSLVRTPPNVLPDVRGIPPLSVAVFLAMSITAAPLTEEIAFRGYAMGLLRPYLGPAGAIAISSLMFAAVHLTQGLYATKLVVYLLFGLSLALMVWRTGSLEPAMVVHAFGDLVFFTTVWPNDAMRRLVSEGGADAGFFVSVVIAGVGLVMWAFAFRRLILVTSSDPTDPAFDNHSRHLKP